MYNWNGLQADARYQRWIKDWSVDVKAIRIRAVQNQQLFTIFRTSFHHVLQGVDVSVKTHTHILYVKNHDVYIRQVCRCWLLVFSVKGNGFNASFRIHIIINLYASTCITSKAMLRAKDLHNVSP